VDRKHKVYTKDELELIGADFFKLISKHYPNMDEVQLACMMAYASCYVLHSISTNKCYREVGGIAYHFLTTELNNAALSFPEEGSEVQGCDSEDNESDPIG
jgi:hypothetical protein